MQKVNDSVVTARTRVFKLELTVFLRMCEGVNTPRSLACFLLAKAGEFEQYLGLTAVDPDSGTFADDYLVTSALKKHPDLPNVTVDREIAALSKWREAESMCLNSNARIRAYLSGARNDLCDSEDLLNFMQSFIARTLGPLDRHALERIEEGFRFGPGSTTTISGRDVVLSRKVTSVMEMTPQLYPFWNSLRPFTGSEAGAHDLSIRASNRVTFVPKTALTDRAIAIEPHCNILVQLGIGQYLKDRLLSAGINLTESKRGGLRNQADQNRIYASLAKAWSLATIDLESASDTVSYELVKLLLPVDWFALLSTCRSEYSELPSGEEIRLEKFSSMGNGFTFELETLVFLALTRYFDKDSQVFGDDIIVRQDVAHSVCRSLALLGFKVNKGKTYLAGRFFESCGEDYFDGCNVRPLYLKGNYESFTAAVIRICNKVRIYAHRRCSGLACDRRFLRAWLSAFYSCDKARRTGVPAGLSDNGLIKNFDEFSPTVFNRQNGYSGYRCTIWQHRPRKSLRTDVVGAYIASLWWGSDGGSRLIEYQRKSVHAGKFCRIQAFTWYDLGPWV